MDDANQLPSSKGEQTRRLIVDTAVALVRERGYEKTTMRAIAEAAGVSVGNAYYYFSSKDALLQGFYVRLQADHRDAATPVLATETELGPRLRGVLHALVDTLTPYHSFAGKFIGIAAEPHSVLSPFSPESGPAREISLGLYRELVEGTGTKMDAELRAELPEALWLVQLALTVFWVHDDSPGQARTRLLIDSATPLAERLISLSRLRVFRSLTQDGLALYRALRSP